jgi:hypothetical protein
LKEHEIDNFRRQAQAAFLGREPVFGIGLTKEADTTKLAVVLERRSASLESEIREWAERHGMEVSFSISAIDPI